MASVTAMLQRAIQEHRAGRLEAAAAGYQAVLRANPRQGDALHMLGLIAHTSRRHDEAITLLRRAIKINPDTAALHNTLGDAYRLAGHLDNAEQSLRRALALQPSSIDAATNLALVYYSARRIDESIALMFDVLAVQPETPALRSLLISALQSASTPATTPQAESVLIALCEHADGAAQSLLGSIVNTLRQRPAFDALLRAESGRAHSGAEGVGGVSAEDSMLRAAVMSDPLLLVSLPRLVFADVGVERVLTALRAHLLDDFLTHAMSPGTGGRHVNHAFTHALARQAFVTEYAWYVSDKESAAVDALIHQLNSALSASPIDVPPLVDTLEILACYAPLTTLEYWEKLAHTPAEQWPVSFRAVIREQLLDTITERNIAQHLPTLTPIDDAVSQVVRTMYEENPYPRWLSIQRPTVIDPRAFLSELQTPASRIDGNRTDGQQSSSAHSAARPIEPTRILVAGCGTGRQPLQIALQFAHSQVLAIDLSMASLAYAARKATELGVASIAFAQADLLALQLGDTTFHIISCSGVLHHLANPEHGWRSLMRYLAPGGVMKIGLYATAARADIEAARAFMREHHVEPTPGGLRESRRALLALPTDHPAQRIVRFQDFFTLSGYRDLVMHVQERTYTIPELASMLDALKLEFLGFQLDNATLSRFRATYPDPSSLRDFSCWSQFEAMNPDTFAGMYQFWCGRRV